MLQNKRPLGASLRPVGAILEPLGVAMGHIGGRSWGHLGDTWGHLAVAVAAAVSAAATDDATANFAAVATAARQLPLAVCCWRICMLSGSSCISALQCLYMHEMEANVNA